MKNILIVSLLSFFLFSCEKEQELVEPIRTLLVYMVADNDLNSYAEKNINQIVSFVEMEGLKNCNILVYLDGKDLDLGDYVYNGTPELIQIKINSQGAVIKEVVKSYEEQNSVDPLVMKTVFKDVGELYPTERYGLILWSHGSSWLPSNYKSLTRSFGNDNGDEIEIIDLAKTIPAGMFDFIMFDACALGSIECVYELKDKTDYIVSSSAEVFVDGYPYDKILPYLMQKEPDLDKAAFTFYDYYNNKSEEYRAACISVVKTSNLSNVAIAAKAIIGSNGESVFYNLDRSQLQLLAYINGIPPRLYDFEDTMSKVSNEENREALSEALNNAVISKYSTPKLYAMEVGYYDLFTFCGLSFYPAKENYPSLNNWYHNLAWYKDVYE